MFKTGIVLFYVKEHSKEETKRITKVLKKYKSELNFSISEANIEPVSNNLPIGTIICQDTSIDDNNICICLPMFSSHISMPVKTNECVWFFTHVERKSSTSNTQDNLPLLDLKNYWLSRKIGTKISEEANFCFYQRDALINKDSSDRINSLDKKINSETDSSLKKALLKDKENEENIIRLPNFNTSPSYLEIYPGIESKSRINKSNTFKTKEVNDKFFLRPVPRWYSKSHELSLQGSNNTLINLGVSYLNNSLSCKDKGIIDLVSGRHFIRKYIPNSDQNTVTFENKNVDNFSNTLTVELPTDSFVVLENSTTRKKENIKNTDYYLNNSLNNEKFYDFEKKEGIVNFQNDASRIYISELEEKIDDGKFYDTEFLKFQSVLIDPFDNLLLAEEDSTISFDNLNYMKDIKIKNLQSEPLEERGDKNINLNMTPAIFMKSNNIRIVARKEFEAIDENLPAGSIRLIKEDNEFDYYSHITLENDGQVLLDGSSILLGNFKRELARQDKKIENANTMHGKGNSLLIGYEETLAEPLVLGDSLKNMISELIQINVFVLDELKKVSEDLQMHVHAGVFPGGSITGTRVATLKTDMFVNTEHSKAADQYVHLENSLNKILSRFAKTT